MAKKGIDSSLISVSVGNFLFTILFTGLLVLLYYIGFLLVAKAIAFFPAQILPAVLKVVWVAVLAAFVANLFTQKTKKIDYSRYRSVRLGH